MPPTPETTVQEGIDDQTYCDIAPVSAQHRVDLDRDFLREGATLLNSLLMDLETREKIGAKGYERREGRQTHYNGYRGRG